MSTGFLPEVAGTSYVLRGKVDTSFLQLGQFWVVVSDQHTMPNVEMAQFQLPDEGVDCSLQPWCIILLGHAAAVQQVAEVDYELVAAIHVIDQTCNLSRAVLQLDARFVRTNVVEQGPAIKQTVWGYVVIARRL
jgi:hypothetical protein